MFTQKIYFRSATKISFIISSIEISCEKTHVCRYIPNIHKSGIIGETLKIYYQVGVSSIVT